MHAIPSFQDIVTMGIRTSPALFVFAFALEASLSDALYLFRHPASLMRSLLSMNIVMPLVAIIIALMLPMNSTAPLPLIARSLSPVPPFMPKKQQTLGGTAQYTIGLFAATALLSIIVVPLFVSLIGDLFGAEVSIPPSKVARIVAATVLMPLAAGIAVHWAFPNFAKQISALLSRIATVILVLCAIPLLIIQRSSLLGITGDGTLLVLAAFAIIGLAAGHFLGGPDPDDRTVLALATASRHPGIALAILAAAGADKGRTTDAVLLYLIVVALVSMLYAARRKSERAAEQKSYRS